MAQEEPILELDLDFKVEAGFFFFGRWPNALLTQIGQSKVELFKALRPNPLEPDMLQSQKEFAVQGRHYLVICEAKAGYTPTILRVVRILKLPL